MAKRLTLTEYRQENAIWLSNKLHDITSTITTEIDADKCICLMYCNYLLVLFSPKKITKSKVFFVQKAYNPELFHELAFEMKDKMSKSRLPRKYWEE